MNTFIPFGSDFVANAVALDWRRLGKQRIEVMQMHNAIIGISKGWASHPATRMWEPFAPALCALGQAFLDEWKARGYKNSMPPFAVGEVVLPPWIEDPKIMLTYQANLVAKDPGYYAEKFPGVEPMRGYYWPTKMPEYYHLYRHLNLPEPDSDGFIPFANSGQSPVIGRSVEYQILTIKKAKSVAGLYRSLKFWCETHGHLAPTDGPRELAAARRYAIKFLKAIEV